MTRLFCLGPGKTGLFGFPACERWVVRSAHPSALRGRPSAAPDLPHGSLAAEAHQSLANFRLVSGLLRLVCCSEMVPRLGPLLPGAPGAALVVYLLFICCFVSPGWGRAKQRWGEARREEEGRGMCITCREAKFSFSPVFQSLLLSPLPITHSPNPVMII